MIEMLSILVVAALFVVFGLFHGRRDRVATGCGCHGAEGCGTCKRPSPRRSRLESHHARF